MSEHRPRIAGWFSAGAASAVACKIMLARFAATHDVTVVRCIVPDEHPDNNRFAADCATWFGVPVVNLASTEYASAEAVWEQRRYMSGVAGAPCTAEMKRAPRHAFEREWMPDFQVYGFTSEERDRAARFRAQNPECDLITPLIEAGLSKPDCLAIVDRAGIAIPAIYRLGFENANCLGCVKAQSPAYWNRTRRHFPEVFARRAELSREIGCKLVKLTSGERDRIFLDELDPSLGAGEREPDIDCSLLCWMAEQDLRPAA